MRAVAGSLPVEAHDTELARGTIDDELAAFASEAVGLHRLHDLRTHDPLSVTFIPSRPDPPATCLVESHASLGHVI